MSELEKEHKDAGEAISWHVRLQSDAATQADFDAFENWIDDAGNRAEFDRLQLLEAEIESHSAALSAAINSTSLQDARIVDFAARKLTRRAWIGSAIAAGLALIATPFLLRSLTPDWTTYETMAGESKRVELADGSVINLNGASKLRVALLAKERRVEMLGAEASFNVAKDPNRPFLIAAGEQAIRVVGTEFNVLSVADRTQVTVRRGIVQVTENAAPQHKTRLVAGQQFVAAAGEPAVVSAVDPNPAFSWQSGQLIYDDTPLMEVAAALNRRFKTPISVEESAADLRFSGVLLLDTEEAVVRRLEAFLPIEVKRDGDRYVVTKKHI